MKKRSNSNGFERVLINAANLHSGGGVQVAVSFIQELISIGEVRIDIVVSSEIDAELRTIKSQVERFNSYRVYNVFGIRSLFDYKFLKDISSYRSVFTIFGPLYSWIKPQNSIVGFAQPWIIYPENEVINSYNFFQKLLLKAKFAIQRYFYFRSDALVVEANHVRNGLKRLNGKIDPIVVNNCISSVYFDKKKWRNVNYNRKNGSLLLGVVTRDYPHKNLKILPHVAKILKKKYNVSVKFLVTLTKEEWQNKDDDFRQYVDNVGAISVAQCPTFYNLLDGVIFPSLLECFSATPIEAMIMKKPIFASDRLFVKEVCRDLANYFDPNDLDSIALSIYSYFFHSKCDHLDFIDDAYNQALQFNNPSERAINYMRIIKRTGGINAE